MPPKSISELVVENARLHEEALAWRAIAERYREAQAQVAAATEARGYRKEWTDVQFLARQIAKLQEELGELTALGSLWPIIDGDEIDVKIKTAAYFARRAFDSDAPIWGLVEFENLNALWAEAADCQVVLFNIAATLERITGKPFDLVQHAVEKAQSDIPRGVR